MILVPVVVGWPVPGVAENPCVKLKTETAVASSSALTAGVAAAESTNIEKLLSDLDPTSKRAKESVPVLLATLQDVSTEAGLRKRTAMMLSRIGEPARDAVPVLVALLGRTSSPHTNKSPDNRTAADLDPRYWSMKSLGLFGPVAADAVPAVRAILISRKQSSPLRLLAADTLGQLRTAAATGVLVEQLMLPRRHSGHEETNLRQTIIVGIALAGSDAVAALPALSRATEDASSDVRRAACQAIGAVSSQDVGALIPLLERLLLDDDEAVKDAAADAMAQVGSVAVPTLTRLLERGDLDLQWRAARALGQLGPSAKASLSQLRLALQSPHGSLRIEAADALFKISNDSDIVAAALIKEFSSEDRQIRRRAAQILIEMKELPAGVSRQLEELAASQNSKVARTSADVLRERSRKDKQ